MPRSRAVAGLETVTPEALWSVDYGEQETYA